MGYNIIVKVDSNNLIGDSSINRMPRETTTNPDIIAANRADMKHFVSLRKSQSKQHPSIVIMGRKTRESIPARYRPFDTNINCIISTTLQLSDLGDINNEVVEIFDSIESCTTRIESNHPSSTKHIIGGGQIYQQFLDQGLVDTIDMTRLKADFVGDVYFPELGDTWTISDQQHFEHHSFITYQKLL